MTNSEKLREGTNERFSTRNCRRFAHYSAVEGARLCRIVYLTRTTPFMKPVHNSFARSDPFHLEDHRPDDPTEDAYHFIAYLPIGDELYELDGLKPKPVSHGKIPVDGGKWTDLARA